MGIKRRIRKRRKRQLTMRYSPHTYTISEVHEMMKTGNAHGFDRHGADRDLTIPRIGHNPKIDTRFINNDEFCALVTIALNSGHGQTCLHDLQLMPARAKVSFDYPAT